MFNGGKDELKTTRAGMTVVTGRNDLSRTTAQGTWNCLQ
jgi:hypothetical protein